MKGRDWSEDEREQRRRQAIELNAAGVIYGGYRVQPWTVEELALLGTMPDAQVAAQIGKSRDAVRVARGRKGG